MSRVVYNGKRSGGPRSPGAGSEIFTPAHEENVRFIYEGEWGRRPRRSAAVGAGAWGAPAAAQVVPEASGPLSPIPAAWQCVERDLRSQMGSERGLVEEYVEKMPNPSLKGEGAGGTLPGPAGGDGRPRGACAGRERAAMRPLPPKCLLSSLQRLNLSTWVI